MSNLMALIGLGNNKESLTFKTQAVNKKAPFDIDHNSNPHTMSLQRSRYLCIDDNLTRENLFKNAAKFSIGQKQRASRLPENFDPRDHIVDAQLIPETREKKGLQRKDDLHPGKIIDPTPVVRVGIDPSRKLDLRYCCAEEVTEKQKMLLMAKSQLMVKIMSARHNGQR